MLVVSEEKVTVTELHAQVVSGLSLTLRAEPGHPGMVTATAQGTATLRAPKQVRGAGRGGSDPGCSGWSVLGSPVPSPSP